jgi:competence protein ComEC
MKVLRFPLAKITIWFTTGILFAFYAKPGNVAVFSCLVFVSIVLILSWYFSKRDLIQKVHFGLAVYAMAFLAGSVTLIVHSGSFSANSYICQITDSETKHTVKVMLRERPRSTAYRSRYIADVVRIDAKKCTGKIMVNLDHADFGENLDVGTLLQITAPIIKHRPPKNPGQFDYGAYLANKSVMAQIYAGAADVKIAPVPQKGLFYYSDRCRNTIIGNLEKSHFNKKELAVVAALLLGQQQDIDADTIRDYQLAGAVHILSVSGLHVGFLLMFLNFILHFLPNNRKFSYLKLIIIVIALWGFAVLAGLSPSVVRSVTMFSFVAVGMHLRRRTNIFHTLLVSMLLILIFEPSFLFDVGFQLSYLALFFILWLQPLLATIWQPKSKIVHYFWQILTVSFAAQIGTFPLSIYYFHQFPGLFFVTNLVVIPLLSVIMALGIIALLPALFGTVPVLVVKSLEASIVLLNQIIGRIASLEQFIFENIALNRWMMLALYLLFAATILWFEKPNFYKAVFALVSLVLFQGIVLMTRIDNEAQKEWIVFDVPKSTAVAVRTGTEITFFGSNKFKSEKMLQAYATANFCKIKLYRILRNTAYFNGKRIGIIDSLNVYPTNFKPDVLLIRQSPKLNLERLLQKARPQIVVADASNYKSYVKLWKSTCRKYKIPFHATAEMGYIKL